MCLFINKKECRENCTGEIKLKTFTPDRLEVVQTFFCPNKNEDFDCYAKELAHMPSLLVLPAKSELLN